METPENPPKSLSEITSEFEVGVVLAKELAERDHGTLADIANIAITTAALKAVLEYFQAKEQQSVGRGE